MWRTSGTVYNTVISALNYKFYSSTTICKLCRLILRHVPNGKVMYHKAFAIVNFTLIIRRRRKSKSLFELQIFLVYVEDYVFQIIYKLSFIALKTIRTILKQVFGILASCYLEYMPCTLMPQRMPLFNSHQFVNGMKNPLPGLERGHWKEIDVIMFELEFNVCTLICHFRSDYKNFSKTRITIQTHRF